MYFDLYISRCYASHMISNVCLLSSDLCIPLLGKVLPVSQYIWQCFYMAECVCVSSRWITFIQLTQQKHTLLLILLIC